MLSSFNRPGFAAALLMTLFVGDLYAHDTWLAPDRYHRNAPGAVILSLTSGMEFPQLESAIKADRIAIAKARDESASWLEVRVLDAAAKSLTLEAQAPRGVTTFWVVLQPRPSQLEAKQVREYVDHLNVPDPAGIYETWRKKGETTLNYSYTKYAKTFVRAGTPEGGRGWNDATGMRLELVPENDPTVIRAGHTLRLVLLDQGRVQGRYPVSVIHAGATRIYTTDSDGRVIVDVPAAGPYLVRATTVAPSSVPATEWDVHFTTLAFEAHEGSDARQRD